MNMQDGKMDVIVDGRVERRKIDHVRYSRNEFTTREQVPNIGVPGPAHADNEIVVHLISGETYIVKTNS
jgi:hypothetical protein